MQRAEALGPATGSGEVGHRERRGGRGDQSVVREDFGEAAVKGMLRRGLLGDRLDDDAAVAEVGELRHDRRGLLQALASALRRAVAAGPQDDVVGTRRSPREPACDRPAARYSKGFSHLRSRSFGGSGPLVDWSVNRVGLYHKPTSEEAGDAE